MGIDLHYCDCVLVYCNYIIDVYNPFRQSSDKQNQYHVFFLYK